MPRNTDRLIRRRPGTVVGVFVPLSDEEAEEFVQHEPDDTYEEEYDEPVDDFEDDDDDDAWDDE